MEHPTKVTHPTRAELAAARVAESLLEDRDRGQAHYARVVSDLKLSLGQATMFRDLLWFRFGVLLKARCETLFGTNIAIGIRFALRDENGPTGQIVSAAEFDAMAAVAVDNEDYPNGDSLMPDGSPATCCTNYAIHVARHFPGRVKVYGFANENNPQSRVAREQIHPRGHDFALFDNRFIIDPWIRLVPQMANLRVSVAKQFVFDTHDADRSLAQDIYGPKGCWEDMGLATLAAAKAA